MLKNGIVWKDTQGNPLHAHGGYIIFHEGYKIFRLQPRGLPLG